jgi:hypothetical protein
MIMPVENTSYHCTLQYQKYQHGNGSIIGRSSLDTAISYLQSKNSTITSTRLGVGVNELHSTVLLLNNADIIKISV